MRRAKSALLIATVLSLATMLSACENFDMDKFDVFGINEKKKLPGDRRPLFPEGVPGVTQGIPPQLVKGNQPPPADPMAEAAAEAQKAAEAEKAKAKPKPRVVRRQPPPAARITVQPAAQQAPAQQQPAAGQSPWPSTAQQPSPWPSSPQPGTFQR